MANGYFQQASGYGSRKEKLGKHQPRAARGIQIDPYLPNAYMFDTIDKNYEVQILNVV